MKLRHPIARVRGLGSAKSGTAHWLHQRLTALLLLVTLPWLLWLMLSLVGADYALLRASLAQPWNAVLMILFLYAAFWHAQLGLQVVIEDYVHTPAMEIALQLVVKFACLLAGLAAVLAVGRIAFTA